MKPSLASPFISFGRVKASDRKITSGWRSCTSRISHSQNGNGLVCGLSTRKMRTPCSIQNSTTSRSAFHSAMRVGAVEIRIDDVLVFLRRVLGVADRAVRPALEPFRMLLQPGMVGRALHGEVERDFHVVLAAGRRRSRRKSSSVPSSRMHRVVAALARADRVGAAGIVRAGVQRIVACPCGWCGRSDGSASGRRRRSPSRRCRAGARCSRRTCRAGPAPCPGCAAPSRTRRRSAPAAGRRPTETAATAREIGPQLAFGHRGRKLVGQAGRGSPVCSKFLALPHDHRGARLRSRGLRLGQQPAPSMRRRA